MSETTERSAAETPADTTIESIIASQRSWFRFLALFAWALVAAFAALAVWEGFRTREQLAEFHRQVDSNVLEAAQSTQALRRALQQQAHDARQQLVGAQIAQQNLANQQRANYLELRSILARREAPLTDADITAAGQAAERYLSLGEPISLEDEGRLQMITRNASAVSTPPGLADIARGVLDTSRFELSGPALGQVSAASAPPPLLASARDAFQRAAAASVSDGASTHTLGIVGQARVDYLLAAASNFSEAACRELFETIGTTRGVALLTVWQAECQRHTGRTFPAVSSFADAARALGDDQSVGAQRVRMLAYHGLGTSLIASADAARVPRGSVEAALALCPNGAARVEGAAQRRLVGAQCALQRAIELRRALNQSDIEVAVSRTNLGFALLRLGNAAQALQDSEQIDQIAPLAWNDVVYWLAARRQGNGVSVDEARAKLLLYRRGEFNECELFQLVERGDDDALRQVLEATRDASAAPACPSPNAT